MRYDKQTYEHLLGIVLNSKDSGDIADRILQDLAEDTECPETLFKLCDSAIRRAGGKIYQGLDKAIWFSLGIVKRLIDKGDKDNSERILSLLLTDDIISRAYYELSESLVEKLDNRKTAEKVLRREYEILKAIIPRNRRSSMAIQGKGGIESYEEIRDVSVIDFIRLSFSCMDIIGREDSFARDIVEYAVANVEYGWFLEIIEIGEWYANIGNTEKALDYFRTAEELIKNPEEAWILTHNLWHLKNTDKIFSMKIILKAIKMLGSGGSCESYVMLAECAGATDGICDKELCLELFSKGQSVAVNSAELESLKDSLFMVREDWENEVAERKNNNADN
jgi:hypothetical protein